MKNKIVLTVFFLSLFSQMFSGQEHKPTKEEIDFIWEFSFMLNKEVLKKPECFFKEKPFVEEDIFIKTKNNLKTLEVATDSLEKNAKIQLKKDEKSSNIILNSKFPSFYNEGKANENNIIKVDVYKSELRNSKGDSIALRGGGGISFGVSTFYEYKNDKETNLEFSTLNRQSQVKYQNKVIEPIKGNVKYLIKYVTAYDKIRLSKNDTGKKFTLNNKDYILKYVFDNKVIIEKEGISLDDEIDIINLSKNGLNKLVPLSTEEFSKENKKKRESEISSLGTIKSTFTKESFDYFKNNPDITLDDFKKAFPVEKLLNEKKQNPEYLLIAISSPIDNDFILYMPIYGYKRIINVKM